MTDAERSMWRLLREAFPDARFRRQVPLRHFIADFASHRAKLVIEVDGGQHKATRDGARTQLIEAQAALLEQHPHPASPIEGEEQISTSNRR